MYMCIHNLHIRLHVYTANCLAHSKGTHLDSTVSWWLYGIELGAQCLHLVHQVTLECWWRYGLLSQWGDRQVSDRQRSSLVGVGGEHSSCHTSSDARICTDRIESKIGYLLSVV